MKKFAGIFSVRIFGRELKALGLSAFSLIELMISLITISCITAAFTPIITKKLKSSNVSVALSEVTTRCEKFSSECSLCYAQKCIVCSRNCLDSEYRDIPTCTCIGCDTYSSDCLNCNSDRCSRCTTGYGLKDKGCEICPAGTYASGTAARTSCTACSGEKQYSAAGASACSTCEDVTYQTGDYYARDDGSRWRSHWCRYSVRCYNANSSHTGCVDVGICNGWESKC